MRRTILLSIVVLFAACRPRVPPDETSASASALTSISPERAVAARLGIKPRFAIGLGNDAVDYDPNHVSAYTLGPKVDIHYMYLSGLDWPTWNRPDGQYVTMHVNAAKARGVVPMFTLYQGAAAGESNLAALNDVAFMTKYWYGVRTMFQRLGESGVPAIAHIEPDLWGYFQRGGAVPVRVRSLVPECSTLTDDVAGFGRCIVRLARKLAPKAIIGLHASSFGAYTDGAPDAGKVAAYLNSVGSDEADIVGVETLDRDAGCFEAATDPQCQRKGSFYWDDAAFSRHLAWAKTIRLATKKPLLWWQMPLGVPSETPGGSPGRYRDNRVRYVFSNAWRFAEAGGIGAVFGVGAKNQTTVRTDGGQFRDALTKYLASGGNRLN